MHALGFDRSYPVPFERGVRIGCSQREAICINGVPCHERGCPNEPGAESHNPPNDEEQ